MLTIRIQNQNLLALGEKERTDLVASALEGGKIDCLGTICLIRSQGRTGPELRREILGGDRA